ncbi:MAG: hypothetical protein ACKVKV_06680, partial [Dehalococcoidia bacterium]
MVYQDEDEARRTFEKQIEDEFDALDKEMRDLDRVYQVKWQELDVLTQAIFDEAEKEINAKRDELSSMPNSTPEMDALEEQFGQL